MQQKPPSRRTRLTTAAALDLNKWRKPVPSADRTPSSMHLSVELVDVHAREYSEMCPERAQDMDTSYESFCANASLAPSPTGWGFLHCKVRDGRGRTRRLTLATNDLSYHRLLIEALPMDVNTEAHWNKYAYMRAGWPGPEKWRGNWDVNQLPIPWRPTQRNACPEEDTRHVHSMLIQAEAAPEVAYVIFAESPGGHRWTMLDGEAPESQALVVAPSSEDEFAFSFHLKAGVAVIPGWPTKKTPESCADPACGPV